jgi:hypothetical protein
MQQHMSRLSIWIPVAALILLVGYGLSRAMQSDETRIRNAILDAGAAFNATRLDASIAPFAADYHCETMPELDPQALKYAFATQRDSQKRFQLRVRVPEDRLEVELGDQDPDAAEARFRLEMERRSGAEWTAVWTIDCVAELRRTADGWRIRRSRHETVAGRMPR